MSINDDFDMILSDPNYDGDNPYSVLEDDFGHSYEDIVDWFGFYEDRFLIDYLADRVSCTPEELGRDCWGERDDA